MLSRHALGGRQGKSTRRRGVALVLFITFALPIVLLALALAVDTARLVTTGRKVAQVADAAALAGAQQLAYDKCDPALDPLDGATGDAAVECRVYKQQIDPDRAREASQFMVTKAVDSELVPSAGGLEMVDGLVVADGGCAGSAPDGRSTKVVDDNKLGTSRMTVTLCYEPAGLLFLPALDAILGSESVYPSVYYITRSADLCTEEYQGTDGYCARPAPPTSVGG